MNQVLAVLIALMIAVSGLVLEAGRGTQNGTGIETNLLGTDIPLVPVTASLLPNTSAVPVLGNYTGQMNVMVSFRFAHFQSLQDYLQNLSNPLSPQYHRYMTAAEFDSHYSPSTSFYNNAVSYFMNHGAAIVNTFGDHVSIDLVAEASYFNSAFNTTMHRFTNGNNWFYSVSSVPELPAWLAGNVTSVVGLSNYTEPKLYAGSESLTGGVSTAAPTKSNGYPVPLSYNGAQLVWGSDFQVAYNEQKLLSSVYPVNVSIATILWAGNDSSGSVAPFYPKDVYTYFNDTLATGQPIPKVYGVPLDGAPAPGISATYDTTSASFENTLDLEMVGSTAPGSSIYNVYTPNNSFSSLDQSLAYIVNANNTTNPGLAKVSVITNSWYSGQHTDPVWNQYLMEAQARGITVLASSGDSGDNSSSSKYLGSDASFPGTASYNTYGMISVGGSSVKLYTSPSIQTFLHISNQTAWYVPGPSQADKTSIGSQGGIDQNITEPTWQLNSIANNVIQGKGRGVPDIGAVANNTIIYMTVKGVSYYDNPSFYIAWGTSIASPLEAGIIAEMNAYMQLKGLPDLGFMNPSLYKLGNLQYGTSHGNILSSNHTFLNPFFDVVYGHNDVYNEEIGYSLVTGLGSIDAYNMTMDLINNFTEVTLYTITVNIILSITEKITGIYLNGQLLPWTVSSFKIFLTNGSYSYNVTLKNGTANSYSNGNFSVNGTSGNITIRLTNQTTVPSTPLLGSNPLLFVLVIILATIVLISVLTRRKK